MVAALCGGFVLVLLVANAAIPGLVVGLPLFFGVASFCLFVGVTIRKAVAGTVLPFGVDTDE
ncbi:hypothetical protein SAMN04487950_2257 [Halogranum rubrum]|uniref:Uncharacterized protein n=2 Tax=Halogranum rubrum TaxID=553466 RepID=A0A1I4EQX0_9EURY|nr:hypothetical protein SAMN04487950_2257 [Halogranum rubrum]